MNKLSAALLSVVAGCYVVPAFAQFAKPEDAIKYRKAAMNLQAAHFGRVAAMASGRVPFDAKVAADNAAIAETISKLPWAAFVEGSDKGETKANPEVWSNAAKFKEASEKMQGEMTKLAAAAKTGNLDSIKASVGAVGGSCKACHDVFWKQ